MEYQMKTKLFFMFIPFWFVQNICSQKLDFGDSQFVVREQFEVLEAQNRDKLLEFYPEIYQEPELDESYIENYFYTPDMYLYWYHGACREPLRLMYYNELNSVDKERFFYRQEINVAEDSLCILSEHYSFIINSFKQEGDEITLDIHKVVKYDSRFDKPLLLNPDETDKYKAKIIIDGDYLYFYIEDIFINTYCRIDGATLEQYDNLRRNNKCDLSKVTWPHHADGTSEYEERIVIPKPVFTVVQELGKEPSKQIAEANETEQASKPEKRGISYLETTVAVKKKTVMTVSELTALMLDPRENAPHVTSVVQGTKVKILKVGKKATLHGRTSNWVYVNFPEGGKNHKGENIYDKAEGWLFGGFLE